jgi:hypothetical protein
LIDGDLIYGHCLDTVDDFCKTMETVDMKKIETIDMFVHAVDGCCARRII